MRQSYKNLVSDTAVFAVGNMLTKAIQFFLLPMYTALLSAEQYGIGELVNNLSELLYPLCCFDFLLTGMLIERKFSPPAHW